MNQHITIRLALINAPLLAEALAESGFTDITPHDDYLHARHAPTDEAVNICRGVINVHSQAAAFDIMKAYAARVAKEALQQFGKRSVGRPTWKVEPLADGRLRVHFGDKTPMMILAEFVEIIFIVAGDGTTLTPWPASPVVSYLRQRLRTL